MDSEAEALLVARVKQGDQQAFNCLLDHHIAMINQFAYRMVNNSADADDITQEVFLRLWHKIAQFNPDKARLSTWLHQIAHNLCIDLFRKKTFSATDEIDSATADTDLARDLHADQHRRMVQQAVANLPERQRSALVLCHFQGLSNKQASIIMEVSVEALESLLSRARRKLKAQMQDTLAAEKAGETRGGIST